MQTRENQQGGLTEVPSDRDVTTQPIIIVRGKLHDDAIITLIIDFSHLMPKRVPTFSDFVANKIQELDR
jgi:hypothetical protein